MKGLASGRGVVIAVPFVFLLVFFLLPFAIVGKISLSGMGAVSYEPVRSWADLRWSNYALVVGDSLYLGTYLSSLRYAAATTLLCLLIGYPFAYCMARAKPSRQPALLMLVMLPFWTSFLLRVYAWKGLLSDGGPVAEAIVGAGLDQLLRAGLISTPGQLMNTPFSMIVGMTYSYLPFMVLPLYANLARMDLRLLEAAADLGASPWSAFWRITVPLSWSGIVAGAMLVFIPCVGEYVIPELLGGPETLMIGRVIWDEFFANNDWPVASTVAVLMVLLVLVPLALFSRAQAATQR